MTNEKKLAAILKIVSEYENDVVRYYEEDFMVDDYAGGNIDDAWSSGMEDGKCEIAHEILAILNK